MKSRGSTLLGVTFSVALSHCRSANITNAVVFCRSPTQLACVGDTIAGIAQVATHPAIIPALLCNLRLDVLKYNISAAWSRLFKVEAASGQSGIQLFSVTGPIPIGNCDDPNLSKKAIGVAQQAIAWDSYAKAEVEFV